MLLTIILSISAAAITGLSASVDGANATRHLSSPSLLHQSSSSSAASLLRWKPASTVSDPQSTGRSMMTRSLSSSPEEAEEEAETNVRRRKTANASVIGGMASGSVRCKNLVEFRCDNDKCVPLSKFCDGTDDCGDSSDEPMACTNCNRTLYGQVGQKYSLRLTEPFQRFQPFVCQVNFAAPGDDFGDIVELTFLSFQIGSFEIGKNQTAGCYSGHLTLAEHSQQQLQRPPSSDSSSSRGDSFLMSRSGEQTNSRESSSNRQMIVDGSSPSSVHFGRFCGQMSVRSATFFSEGNNVSLIISLPSRASVLIHSFSLYLTYKFVQSWPAVTRFGPPGDPFELGLLVPGTYCDRVFDDCSSPKKCKIRSPNWPGFYNRNITCKFSIRNFAEVPIGHRMRIVISQANEYKISLFAGTNSAAGGHSISSGSLQSDCPLDVVRIYDGLTVESPLLIEFCGSGSLPDVVASRPEALVVLESAANQILYNSRLELDVRTKLEPIQESDQVMKTGLCDFVYSGQKIRSGVISSPKHSTPVNMTCTYKFFSENVYDRIWIYFMSYFVHDKHQWASQERCDVSRLEIYDYVFVPLKNNGIALQSEQRQQKQQQLKSKVYSFCEKTSPKICGRASDAENHLPITACTHPNESYFFRGSQVVIKQQFFKHYDVYAERASFSARFEFVDTYQDGVEVPGTLCDRQIFSDNQPTGRFSSPKNVFLYHRGGRENMSCSFHLIGNATQRLRITFDSIRLQSVSCQQLFDPETNQYECRVFQTNKPKIALLTIFDSLASEYISTACLCNYVGSAGSTPNTDEDPSKVVFDLIGSSAIVNFSITRMAPLEDADDYGFSASYEFLPAYDCDSRGFVQIRNGSEGEIQYSVPSNYDFAKNGPFKCRWLVEASIGKHLYLKFKGHLASSKNTDCLNGNRFVVYAGSPRRVIATVCTRAKRSGDANSAATQLEEFDLFSLSWYNDSEELLADPSNGSNDYFSSNYYPETIFIELMAYEYGDFRVRWLEVTKPFLKTQTGKTLRNINCLVECPELNACINPELWCDGTRHCPSGYDESSEHCSKFPTLYVLSIGGLALITILISILVMVVYRLHRRRKFQSPGDIRNSSDGRCNQHHDLDYYPDFIDYPEYPRLGGELNYRMIRDSRPPHTRGVHANYDYHHQNELPMEITHSFVPSYYNNNVF